VTDIIIVCNSQETYKKKRVKLVAILNRVKGYGFFEGQKSMVKKYEGNN
jgi:hypothetical protein